MSRRDMKSHWYMSGFACLVIYLYFITCAKEQRKPELGSVIHEDKSMPYISSISENMSAQETQNTGDARPHSVDVSGPSNSPVAGSPSIEETPFLDPDLKSTAAKQNDINRTPINVGEYLDANGGSPLI